MTGLIEKMNEKINRLREQTQSLIKQLEHVGRDRGGILLEEILEPHAETRPFEHDGESGKPKATRPKKTDSGLSKSPIK